MIDPDLRENGKPVQLEVAVFKPNGAGPFPLLVFNHGSTGDGKDSELFGLTSPSVRSRKSSSAKAILSLIRNVAAAGTRKAAMRKG